MISGADELRRADPAPLARPSKTRRKQAMHALQALGESLVALDPARLAALELPEPLADAVAAARRMSKHEARRRQMQYIGRLMRDVDPAPLEAALAGFAREPAFEHQRFVDLERWRERVLEEREGLEAFVAAHPRADREALAGLIAEVRAERARGAPPQRYRELFRALRRAADDAA